MIDFRIFDHFVVFFCLANTQCCVLARIQKNAWKMKILPRCSLTEKFCLKWKIKPLVIQRPILWHINETVHFRDRRSKSGTRPKPTKWPKLIVFGTCRFFGHFFENNDFEKMGTLIFFRNFLTVFWKISKMTEITFSNQKLNFWWEIDTRFFENPKMTNFWRILTKNETSQKK